MSSFQLPPKGSTIKAELLKGRICDRTGHLSRARIRHEDGFWIVENFAYNRDHRFESYPAAIRFFNRLVGYLKNRPLSRK